MTHNSRCENSKRDRKFCKCSCAGTYHGGEENGGLAPDEIRIDESYGGEVAEFIREARGKEYRCFGTHPYVKNKTVEPDSFLHIAREFKAYPHDGGLADAQGRKWWVFVECDNPMPYRGQPISNAPRYATSFVHFPGQVEAAKRERDWQTQFENAEEMRMDGIRAEEGEPWERDY